MWPWLCPWLAVGSPKLGFCFPPIHLDGLGGLGALTSMSLLKLVQREGKEESWFTFSGRTNRFLVPAGSGHLSYAVCSPPHQGLKAPEESPQEQIFPSGVFHWILLRNISPVTFQFITSEELMEEHQQRPDPALGSSSSPTPSPPLSPDLV